jgi:alpha-amylase
MERKSVKKCISWLLALAMVFTLVPVSSMRVEAAVKPALSTAQVTIAKGMSQTVKVKNAAKGAKTKWKSDDSKTASVSASGVIKGVKDGKTTVRCTVTVSGKKTTLKCKVIVKTPKFEQSKYAVNQGEKITLSLTNRYSGSTYQWSSDNKKVVTVNQKGQVTGVSAAQQRLP